MRVRTIVDELRGEKIDIVKYSADPEEYVANALSPSKVIVAVADENEKICRVIVPDYQLSLAIGKEGQNARLAAKLTGWKIDIKSETQALATGELEYADDSVESTHVSPDGDTLGSTLALAEGLKQTGKKVTIMVDDEIASTYSFMPGIGEYVHPKKGQSYEADLLVIVDSSSLDRIGIVEECVKAPILNIDHHAEIKKLVEFQEKIQAEIGKPKMAVPVYIPPAEIAEEIKTYGEAKLKAALMDEDKHRREEMVDQVKAEIAQVFIEKYPENAKDVAYITQKLIKAVVRRTISVDKIRPDGRKLDEVRKVTCEVGILARPHAFSILAEEAFGSRRENKSAQ